MAETDGGAQGTSNTPEPEVKTPEPSGKKEEYVPMSKYVGVKEMLRKAEQAGINQKATLDNQIVNLQTDNTTKDTQIQKLGAEVSNLNEQNQGRISAEDHSKVQGDLKTKTEEILSLKKKSVQTKFGVAEEDLKDLSESDLSIFEKALSLGKAKTVAKADTGGGGGVVVSEKPMDRAKNIIDKAKERDK